MVTPKKLATHFLEAAIVVIRNLLHLWSGVSASCRFEPTCSQYAREALRERGLLRGGYSAMRRILRCHPWSSGGIENSFSGGMR